MLPGKHARACAFQPKAKRGRERHPRHEPPRPHGEGPRVPPRETRSGHADRLHTRTLQVQKRDETSQRSRAAFLNIQSPAHA